MKQSEKVAICLVAGLLLAASARAVTSDAQGNPYQSIVERNVFALKPPPDPETLKPQAPPPPPIELQGITSMFGRQQVFFSATVPGSKPGEPPKKTPMVLKVGERQDDIEVLAINEAAGSVKFNNHGTEEEKFLDKDSAKLTAAPVVAPFPGITTPGRPGVPPPAAQFNPGAPGGSSVTTFGSAGSTLRNIPSRVPRGPMASASSGVPMVGVTAPQTTQTTQQKPLSPEEQIALMKVMQEAASMPGGDKLIHGGNSSFVPPPPPMPPMPQQ